MFPVLFEIPGIGWPIYSYGVMLGISIIAGWYLTLGLAERDGLPRRLMGSCYFWGIAVALAGARVLYLITNPDEFNDIGDFFRFREGGLVAYGGFLGGLLGSYAYCRVKKINIWAWADATAAPIALGLAITRLGCFLYGCCYGRRVTDDDPGWLHSIAMRFPNWSERFPDLAEHNLNGAPAFSHHVAHLGLERTAEMSYAIAPTQLMASINGFVAVAIILLVLRPRRTFRGLLFFGFCIYYGLARFFFEIVRDDTQRGTIGPDAFGWYGGFEGRLTTSQVIAIVTVLASIGGIIYFWYRSRKDPERAMSLGEGVKPQKDEEKDQPKRPRRSPSKRKKKK